MPALVAASDVAAYLLWLAAHECEGEPEYLTPLKLQKLLYYVQGWTIAEWGGPMFAEPIEAWKNGPVVRAIHNQYKAKGQSAPIITDPAAPRPESLPAEHRALIHSIWDAYKQYSGIALRDLTHAERPYLNTYTPQDPDGRCSKAIEFEELKNAFSGRAQAILRRLEGKRDKLLAFARADTSAHTDRDAF
jgi:uncharacterized phage-associated protein